MKMQLKKDEWLYITISLEDLGGDDSFWSHREDFFYNP